MAGAIKGNRVQGEANLRTFPPKTDARSLIAALGPDSPAERILKCNMIPSSLSFLPPWLFFAVFKGMFLLSACSPAFSTLLRSTSLLTAHSPCSTPQMTSLFLTHITSTLRARVPPCCGLPGRPLAFPHSRPTSGFPPAPLSPRPSPSSSRSTEGCSSACQHCYRLSHPDPGHLRHPTAASACPDFPLAVVCRRLNWGFGSAGKRSCKRSVGNVTVPEARALFPFNRWPGQVSVAGWVLAPHDCSLSRPAPSSECWCLTRG